MKNKNQTLASLWSLAIVVSILACIFAILFAALTGRDKTVKETAPAETEITATAEPAETPSPEAEETSSPDTETEPEAEAVQNE